MRSAASSIAAILVLAWATGASAADERPYRPWRLGLGGEMGLSPLLVNAYIQGLYRPLPLVSLGIVGSYSVSKAAGSDPMALNGGVAPDQCSFWTVHLARAAATARLHVTDHSPDVWLGGEGGPLFVIVPADGCPGRSTVVGSLGLAAGLDVFVGRVSIDVSLRGFFFHSVHWTDHLGPFDGMWLGLAAGFSVYP